MRKISILILIAFVTGCKKDESPKMETGVSQKVIFNISPKKDYSNYPENYFLNIVLRLNRRAWATGTDIPVWDTIIPKKVVKSLQSFEVINVIRNTDQSTGIITAIMSSEYYYDDNLPIWSESTSTKLEYNQQNHTVSFSF